MLAGTRELTLMKYSSLGSRSAAFTRVCFGQAALGNQIVSLSRSPQRHHSLFILRNLVEREIHSSVNRKGEKKKKEKPEHKPSRESRVQVASAVTSRTSLLLWQASIFPAALRVSQLESHPAAPLLTAAVFTLHIISDQRISEAKGFLVLENLLLLLQRSCTGRAIPKAIAILHQELTRACRERERLPGTFSITSYPQEQTSSISNAKVDLSRILTPVHIPTAVTYKLMALERCVTQRIFSVSIFIEKEKRKKANKQNNTTPKIPQPSIKKQLSKCLVKSSN